MAEIGKHIVVFRPDGIALIKKVDQCTSIFWKEAEMDLGKETGPAVMHEAWRRVPGEGQVLSCFKGCYFCAF